MDNRIPIITNTIKEMFTQRGYSDIQQSVCYLRANRNDGMICCAILDIKPKLNNAQLKEIMSEMNVMKINNFIIICDNETPAVKQDIKISNSLIIREENKQTTQKMNIELFRTEDLLFNITKHKYSYPHLPLDNDELKNLKKKCHVSQLPVLLRSDPVCRFYNFDRGTVVKILRRDGTVGYRIVKSKD